MPEREMIIMAIDQNQASLIAPDSTAKYMAMGIVCVCPGILPANIKVAPNSPKALAKAKVVAATMPGNAKGKLMRQKIVNSLAPKVLATRRRLVSICIKDPSAVLYIIGNETTVAAIAAPYQVKTIVVS